MYVLVFVTYGFFVALYLYCLLGALYYIVLAIIEDIGYGNFSLMWLLRCIFLIILVTIPIFNIYAFNKMKE